LNFLDTIYTEIYHNTSIAGYLGLLDKYFPLSTEWKLKTEQQIPLTPDKDLKETDIWYSKEGDIHFSWLTGAQILAEIIDDKIDAQRLKVVKKLKSKLNLASINKYFDLEEEELIKENDECISQRIYELL
jgi:hypothetical protein